MNILANKNLQLFSFEVNKDNIIDKTIYTIKFPEEIKKLINNIKGLKSKRFGYNFALKGLAKIAMNYCRDIIYVNNSHSDLLFKDKIWIYSTSQFNLDGLSLHICEWINSELRGVGKLAEEFFLSEQLKLENEIKSNELFNGNYELYNTIPNLYARDMCNKPIFFSSINTSFKFYLLIDENEAGLISEPIFKGNVEPFSYYIKLSLIRPYDGNKKFFINVVLKTKLWRNSSLVDDKENYVDGKQGTSIYIFKKDDFARKQPISFIQCMFTRAESGAKWKNSYDSIYGNNINLDINDVIKNPINYMNLEKDLVCLITNKYKKTKTKRGLGASERINAFNIFKEMYPNLIPRDYIQGVKYSRLGKSLKIENCNRLMSELKRVTIKVWNKYPLKLPEHKNFNKLIIHIYSANDELFFDSILFSKSILGLREVNKKFISPQGLKIEFKHITDNIMRELFEEESKSNRIYEIEKDIAHTVIDSVKILALIDIPSYHNNKSRKHLDSKSVVRVALKNKGIISQFINGYDNKESQYKLQNALFDLYYSAGFLNDEFFSKGFGGKILIGVDFVSNCNRKLLVMSKLEKGNIYYKIYKDEKWHENIEFLCSLDEKVIDTAEKLIKKEKDIGVNNWIFDTIQEVIDSSKEEIYVYADASLRKFYWKFLINNKFNMVNLGVVDDNNRLNIIRINNTYEIPDYYIGDGTPNLEKGLFTNDCETYYMVGARSDTFKIGSNWTKYDSPTTQLVKQRLTEVIILGGDKNIKLKIAQESFLLRKLVPTYDKETLLPLPLYVINKISEYVNAIEDVR